MADWRLDQKTEETPQDSDLSMLVRGTSVFKTTFQKIKEFIIGTTSMGTTATDVTGAVKEINDKVGIIDVENDGDIASQLKDIANEVNKLSNPNLLINGDFQVWQRGTELKIKSGVGNYIPDRWLCTESALDIVLEKKPKGIGIKDNPNNGYWTCCQKFEKDLSDRLEGKTVTYSLSKNDTIYFKTLMYDSSINGQSLSNIFGDIGKFTTNDTVNWIKLELGAVATPFTPRPYAEELALCQRYYEVTASDDMFVGIREPVGNYLAVYNFKVEKRVSPTVTVGHNLYGDGKMYLLSRHTGTEVEVTPVNMGTTQVRLSSPTREDDSVNSCSFCGWIKAEAEIY